MAALTVAGSTWDTTNSPTTHTVVATPAANDLIVVVHGGSGYAGGDSSTITDNNADGLGVYTKIGSDPLASNTNGALWISIRNALVGSATSTTFSEAEVGLTGGGLTVFRVSGMSRTGSSAAKQQKGESTQTENPPSLTFDAATLTENPIIIAFLGNDSTPNVTQPADFSEAFDSGWGTPTTGLVIAHINSGKTASTYAWTGGSTTAHCDVGVELDTSSAAAGSAGARFFPILGVA